MKQQWSIIMSLYNILILGENLPVKTYIFSVKKELNKIVQN